MAGVGVVVGPPTCLVLCWVPWALRLCLPHSCSCKHDDKEYGIAANGLSAHVIVEFG